jgi:hypothetical protein
LSTHSFFIRLLSLSLYLSLSFFLSLSLFLSPFLSLSVLVEPGEKKENKYDRRKQEITATAG